MVGGNTNNNNAAAKSSTNKPPPPTSAPTAHTAAAASSSQNRKSRWNSSNNNDGGSSNNNNNKNESKPPINQKIADKKLPRPNPFPKIAPIPNQSNPNHPNPTAQSSRPIPPFPFPDSSAAALGAPPHPTYGFHMLERRTIALADGSVRSYFALPPNYQDFPPQSRLAGPEFGRFPPFHPEEFRDQRNHWDHPEGSMKRKYPGEDEIDRRDERVEMLRQRQQFMQYANPNDQSFMGGASTSGPFLRDGGEDVRAAKHMRIGSSRHETGGGLHVDQVALKKSFLSFVKRVFEVPEKKNYLENGRKGRLQCLVCGRFDEFHSVCFLVQCSLLVIETLVGLFFMVALIGLMCRTRLNNEHEDSKKEQ